MTYKERDNILFGDDDNGRYGDNNCMTCLFDGLSKENVETLIREGFIRPDGDQNGSPSPEDFLEFMQNHKSTTVGGFAVSEHRPDYGDKEDRCVLTNIAMIADNLDDMADFANAYCWADEFNITKIKDSDRYFCYAWWD